MASKAVLTDLANSKFSSNNFAAYRQATTKSGSVYYKVTSFDGKYRGWIYGGKKAGKFSGGIEPFTTFDQGNVPSSLSNYTFKIAAPGFQNDGKTVTYKNPLNTTYQSGKQIGDSVKYANTTFKIDGIGTRTRENDTWVHISAINSDDSAANGWILYKGLCEAESPIPDSSLRIDLVDSKGNLIRYINYTSANAKYNQHSVSLTAHPGQLVMTIWPTSKWPSDRLSKGPVTLWILYPATRQASLHKQIGHKASLTVKAADPIPGNSVRINIVNDENAVVDTVDYTNQNAQVGQTLGSTDGGSASLDPADEKAIQSDISTALKKSGYKLDSLSDAQLADLAKTKFGSSVYLKADNDTTTIADNAVRINFTDPSSGKVIKSIDYVNTDADDPAKKGSTLGTETNGKWTLGDSDIVEINALAASSLSGTGYILNNEHLSDDQESALAQAKFGGSITVNVGKAADSNNFALYAASSSSNSANAQQLVPTGLQYVDESWEFPDVGGNSNKSTYSKLSAADIAGLSSTNLTNFKQALGKYSADSINKLMLISSRQPKCNTLIPVRPLR